jgi:hypothetical protein
MAKKEAMPFEYPIPRERYHEYINTSEWKAKSAFIKQYKGNTCQRCGITKCGSDLRAHHKTYDRLGFELLDDLECLCIPCHEKHHKQELLEGIFSTIYKISNLTQQLIETDKRGYNQDAELDTFKSYHRDLTQLHDMMNSIVKTYVPGPQQ